MSTCSAELHSLEDQQQLESYQHNGVQVCPMPWAPAALGCMAEYASGAEGLCGPAGIVIRCSSRALTWHRLAAQCHAHERCHTAAGPWGGVTVRHTLVRQACLQARKPVKCSKQCKQHCRTESIPCASDETASPENIMVMLSAKIAKTSATAASCRLSCRCMHLGVRRTCFPTARRLAACQSGTTHVASCSHSLAEKCCDTPAGQSQTCRQEMLSLKLMEGRGAWQHDASQSKR